jgi:hypothetical protein
MRIEELEPGQRIRVRQTIDRRAGDWQTVVEGVVEAVEVGQTGSWYAHAKDDKFWLRRIRMVKDDGEVSVLNVDIATEVEVLGAEPAAAGNQKQQ